MPLAEIEGPGAAGLHVVEWELQKRLERGEEEIQQTMARGGGRAQAGRGAGPGGIPDNIRYATSEAPAGEYRIVMNANGRTLERRVSILRDEWWQERR